MPATPPPSSPLSPAKPASDMEDGPPASSAAAAATRAATRQLRSSSSHVHLSDNGLLEPAASSSSAALVHETIEIDSGAESAAEVDRHTTEVNAGRNGNINAVKPPPSDDDVEMQDISRSAAVPDVHIIEDSDEEQEEQEETGEEGEEAGEAGEEGEEAGVEGEAEDEDDEEDDEDDDEDDDDEEEDESEGEGEASKAPEVNGTSKEATAPTQPVSPSTGEKRPHPDDHSTVNDGAAAAASTVAHGAAVPAPDATASTGPDGLPVNVLKPKKRRKRQDRTPSPGVLLPAGPPPRPSIRLYLQPLPLHREAEENGDYLLNVPEAMYAKLKPQGGEWVKWYEEELAKATAPKPDEASAAPAAAPPLPEGGPPGGTDDLSPELAALLARHQEPAGGAVKKRRKRREKDDQYDKKDPFVDDSELQFDEPTHSAKPRADGFFVTQGPVELAQLTRPKKSSTKAATAAVTAGSEALAAPSGGVQASASVMSAAAAVLGGIGKNSGAKGVTTGPLAAANKMITKRAFERGDLPALPNASSSPLNMAKLLNGVGTRDTPIAIDDEPSSPPPSSTAYLIDSQANLESKTPCSTVDERLQACFDKLKQKVDARDWSNKKQFPPDLKEPLRVTAKLALELGEYNDNFFNWLPHLFPYNRFTMHKLVKREFYQTHHDELKKLQGEHLQILRQLLLDSLPTQQAEYEAAVAAWKAGGADAAAAAKATPPVIALEADAAPANPSGAEASDEESGAPKLPATAGGAPEKKWRWSEEMKNQIGICVTVEDAMVELSGEKVELEKGAASITQITARKKLYQRVVELFPGQGWTTTTHISREYALFKRRFDRAIDLGIGS